ncbi:MAG TPA: hypothetical protein VG756_30845 [Pseudonocardiaceae bacterium]|nr:hypothetical protein [Pseudonocardiaceae bacterium]
MDTARLRDSWGSAAEYGVQLPLCFYATLLLNHPEVRDMCPPSMAAQRDKPVAAPGTVVSNVDNLDAVLPVLRQLGCDHRKVSVVAEHYPAALRSAGVPAEQLHHEAYAPGAGAAPISESTGEDVHAAG